MTVDLGTLQAVGERVVMKVLDAVPANPDSLIIIPDGAKDASFVGEILAVADDVDPEHYPLEAGDKVIFGKYSGSHIDYKGEKFLFMKASDILAIIHD